MGKKNYYEENYKSVKLPKPLYERIKAEATRRGCFIGHVIREAVEGYFKAMPRA